MEHLLEHYAPSILACGMRDAVSRIYQDKKKTKFRGKSDHETTQNLRKINDISIIMCNINVLHLFNIKIRHFLHSGIKKSFVKILILKKK